MRRAAKRDTVERAIIDTWEEMGAYVESVSGPGLADTLVHHKGRMYRAEVKGAKRGLTKKQVENFTKAYDSDVHTFIIRSPADARTLLSIRDSPDWYRLIWAPEKGVAAGASRKERPFRPGTDRARDTIELCGMPGCATSRVPGMMRCAAHAAEVFAAPAVVLCCERDGCGHSWGEHRHVISPVPLPGAECCAMPSCSCAGYMGLGPASLRRGA